MYRNELMRFYQALKSRANIAVIYAGNPADDGTVAFCSHHPCHWKSYRGIRGIAENIADTLRQLGCRQVHLIPENQQLATALKTKPIHFAWLNSGGAQGFDTLCHAPALLQSLGIPYVGHSPLNVALVDNAYG